MEASLGQHGFQKSQCFLRYSKTMAFRFSSQKLKNEICILQRVSYGEKRKVDSKMGAREKWGAELLYGRRGFLQVGAPSSMLA